MDFIANGFALLRDLGLATGLLHGLFSGGVLTLGTGDGELSAALPDVEWWADDRRTWSVVVPGVCETLFRGMFLP